MANELREARRAAAKGRTDEALVHLWNALEPVRLAGDASALEEVARLATEIERRGGPAERQEAERLLRTLRREPAEERAELPAPPGERAGREPPAEPGDAGEPEPPSGDAWDAGEEDDVRGPAQGSEEQAGTRSRRSQLASRLFPLLFVIIVLVNLLRGLLGDR